MIHISRICGITGHAHMAHLGAVEAHDGHVVEVQLRVLVAGTDNFHTSAAHKHQRGVPVLEVMMGLCTDGPG